MHLKIVNKKKLVFLTSLFLVVYVAIYNFLFDLLLNDFFTVNLYYYKGILIYYDSYFYLHDFFNWIENLFYVKLPFEMISVLGSLYSLIISQLFLTFLTIISRVAGPRYRLDQFTNVVWKQFLIFLTFLIIVIIVWA